MSGSFTRNAALAAMCAALALSACKREDQRQTAGESAEAFAERVGREVGPITGSESWLPQGVDFAGLSVPAGRVSGGSDAPVLQLLDTSGGVDLGDVLGGCAFAIDNAVMLVAAAPNTTDSTGRGVLQFDDRTVIVSGVEAGGPSYIESGPQMTDGTLVVEVYRAMGQPEETAEGNLRWGAELAVSGTGEGTRTYENGTWTCGT